MKNFILVCTLAGSMAWAQSPQVVQNTRTALNTVQKNATAASNQALGIKQAPAKDAHPASKPAPSSASVKPATASTNGKMTIKPVSAPAKPNVAATKSPAKTPAQKSAKVPKLAVKEVPAKKETKTPVAPEKKAEAPKPAAPAPAANPVESGTAGEDAAKSDDDSDKQDKKWTAAGKRDPFISPVVNHTGGSGCSTGKKCLEIGAINLRGVVHSDAGFIAVVTNSLNKAYFLRENDPVFDGYVVKITGDSIIFKETLQDKLGKAFTREVTKKITTPAV